MAVDPRAMEAAVETGDVNGPQVGIAEADVGGGRGQRVDLQPSAIAVEHLYTRARANVAATDDDEEASEGVEREATDPFRTELAQGSAHGECAVGTDGVRAHRARLPEDASVGDVERAFVDRQREAARSADIEGDARGFAFAAVEAMDRRARLLVATPILREAAVGEPRAAGAIDDDVLRLVESAACMSRGDGVSARGEIVAHHPAPFARRRTFCGRPTWSESGHDACDLIGAARPVAPFARPQRALTVEGEPAGHARVGHHDRHGEKV